LAQVGVGFVLQPEEAFLGLLAPVVGPRVDYFEIAPETTWWPGEDGSLGVNGFAGHFAALARRHAPANATGKPFVAHGVGLSLGTADPADRPRQLRWHARLAEDQRRFGFRWLSDHLAVTHLAGEALALPLPLPPTPAAAAQVRRRLAELQAFCPDVAVENTAHYFTYGDPCDEVELIAGVLALPGAHLLLDLYNVVMMGENLGFDPRTFVDRLDLSRVIEIHVAGGTPSEPGWLPSGRSYLLDSHEAAVPASVWALLEDIAPRCPGLRGITLERMEGTVGPDDVAAIADELARLRDVVGRLA
jgi:uncharacterized protein (UPF0276 family)